MKRIIAFYLLIYITIYANSQTGGDNTYEFLNLTNSARSASLGGILLAERDEDINTVFYNPSVLSADMANRLSLNYINYIAGINYGYFSYALKPYSFGQFAGGLHYVNYGEFIEANASGQKTGHFNASEYALNLVYARTLDSMFTVGATIKPVFVSLESYTSFGIAADIGITYYKTEQQFGVSLVFKNLGYQFSRYYEGGEREKLPFEIQLGLVKKLAYAPFRLSLVAHHLQIPRLTYETQEEKEAKEDIFFQETNKQSKFERALDGTLRHIILGVEFIPTKSFVVRFGYNHKRRKEMTLEDNMAMVGFSWGFGLKLKRFDLNYGRASYHLAAPTNFFSLTLNLDSFSDKL